MWIKCLAERGHLVPTLDDSGTIMEKGRGDFKSQNSVRKNQTKTMSSGHEKGGWGNCKSQRSGKTSQKQYLLDMIKPLHP